MKSNLDRQIELCYESNLDMQVDLCYDIRSTGLSKFDS
jgi:hypothetical protein